jgi:hypothetical protein
VWWIGEWVSRRRDARHRRERATCQAEESERLLVETRAKIKPLAELHERNRFSEMIRDALLIGYGHDSDDGGRQHS